MQPAIATPQARRLGLVTAVIALLAFIVAACGGTTAPTATPAPTPADAYSVVSRAVAAPMDKLKINVGISATGDTPVTIDPKSIEVVVDTKAGKGSFHLSLPKSALGADAAHLPIAGDTIDLDVLFDGTALYAKSPLAATLLPMLLAQSGQQVPGDLTGWLKLGTAEEFGALAESLGGMAGASAAPSIPPLSDISPDELKQQLQDAGITVAAAGTEQRNGVESDHITVTVDPTKLASSDLAKELPGGQLDQLQGLAGEGTLSADVWFNKATGALNEIDLNVTDTSGEKATITILVSDPGAVSLDAPAGATELPLAPLLQTLMSSFGGLTSP